MGVLLYLLMLEWEIILKFIYGHKFYIRSCRAFNIYNKLHSQQMINSISSATSEMCWFAYKIEKLIVYNSEFIPKYIRVGSLRPWFKYRKRQPLRSRLYLVHKKCARTSLDLRCPGFGKSSFAQSLYTYLNAWADWM